MLFVFRALPLCIKIYYRSRFLPRKNDVCTFAIGLMEFNSCVRATFYGVLGADASISPMARKVCRVTNQNTAIGNTLQQQHARKDGRLIPTIFTR